ncbi:MAG: exopolyphosphatase [Selenomonas sp.]
MENLAIIDMGSNSIRFIVMQINDNHSYFLQYQQKEAIRLGKGMSETGKLNPDGVKRALECLHVYKHMMEVMQVTRCIAVATAAARSASDGAQFIERIREETGIEIEIISGEREAYLGYLGVVNTIDAKDFIQFDLGGASIEVSLVLNRKIKESVSVPLGAVTMTDKFGMQDIVTQGVLDKCVKHVEKKFREMIPWAKDRRLPVIGIGGTVRNLAKMDQYKTSYQLARIHNYIIPRERFEPCYQAIIKSSCTNRRKFGGLSTERADIIVAGATIARCLMEFSGGKDLIVSGCGLRDGVFYEYYGKKYGAGSPVVKDVLKASVENYLKRVERRMEHLGRVHDLALSLFDQLRRLHGAPKRSRDLLSVAAWLHDAGKIVNYYEHARNSAFIINNAPLYGMTQKEQLKASFIAGFHHGISNKIMRSYRYAMMVTQPEWKEIRKLATLLALAEAADVTYEGLVTGFEAAATSEGVALSVIAAPDADTRATDFEMQSFCKQFKKEFGRPLVIVWRK